MADIAHQTAHDIRRHDRIEYRLLLAAIFAVALPVALASRLLPAARRPFRSRGKTALGEAREAAYTLAPFAFMR